MTKPGPARRPRPKAPADLAERVGDSKFSAFPRATFADVDDPALLEACLLAQDIAVMLRKRLGVLRWSNDELARQAGVQVDQVRNVTDGTGWATLYTVVRLLTAVGELELVVNEERRERPTRPQQQPG